MRKYLAALLPMALLGCSAPTPTDPAPTIVLVHGAHFNAAAWQPLQKELEKHDLASKAVDLPGRGSDPAPASATLESSAAALCQSLTAISGPIALVVHSQGGAIAHQTLSQCPAVSITDIVYVSAVAPIEGAKPFALLSEADEKHYFSGITYQDGWMRITNPRAFAETFTAIPAYYPQVINLAVDEPAATGDGQVNLSVSKLEAIRTSYIFAEQDQIISLASQQKIAASIQPDQQFTLASGHLPMLSMPKALAEKIVQAIRQDS
ncbi:alpha/beta fold hydrolase [Bowmanella yangjiangensis]|uniref:Alpha/beta hydrolase n=1 Tax=Bowmanella yangjiangensis TaxID=2811230 RepID=A0ABS3CML2_9ALTE|nr:alpha/beta hydrolase [Bowmanella yangjiangensis]MBN7818282.1 alpha/beta hydrolase [Bowmanella yangjiangensis]